MTELFIVRFRFRGVRRDDEQIGLYPEKFRKGFIRFSVGLEDPVEWTIVVPKGKLNGCNGEVVVPDFDLSIKLHEGENTVSFTPNNVGTTSYSCWMGMIKSSINVVD